MKRRANRAPRMAFVSHSHLNAKLAQCLSEIVETPSRQADMLRVIFGAGDDPRLVPGGQPHRLGLVELGVLERRQAQEAIPKAWV